MFWNLFCELRNASAEPRPKKYTDVFGFNSFGETRYSAIISWKRFSLHFSDFTCSFQEILFDVGSVGLSGRYFIQRAGTFRVNFEVFRELS